jgi:hypothetical protein
MKRKLKVKKTVIRSLSTVRINGGIIGGWNCDSDNYSCNLPCWVDTEATCPASECYCDPHTWNNPGCGDGEKAPGPINPV